MSAALATGGEQAVFVRALADGYEAAAGSLPEGGPGWLADVRREHLQAFVRGGLPGAREERWRYTSLRALERRAYLPGDAGALERPVDADMVALAGIEGPQLVFVNGRFRADLSLLDALPPGLELLPLSQGVADGAAHERLQRLFPRTPATPAPADAFARVNAALAGDGVLLRVSAGAAIDVPVQLVFVGAEASEALFWNLRSLVELGESARLTLVERYIDADSPAHLGNVVTSVELASGSRLSHVRLQQASDSSSLVAHTDVTVAAGAAYLPVALELGAALSRHEWDIALHGEGAKAQLRGIVLAGGRQATDTRLSVRHVAGGTASDTLWRAIAGGRARSAFHGGIVIEAGADGSDAALETKNLLLSAQAEIDAQPALEIHADEVKASHGAAIGQLDPASLFYLRARGIPEPRARHMLVEAFCRAVLERIEWAGESADAATDVLPALLADAVAQRLLALEAAA